MSGGHWNYLQFELQEEAENPRYSEVLKLLAAIEHELDWGFCGDTCEACAEKRVVEALKEFFDCNARDAMAAVALARDDEQNLCPKCEERKKTKC